MCSNPKPSNNPLSPPLHLSLSLSSLLELEAYLEGVFKSFDEDGSGDMEEDEFAGLLHTLGREGRNRCKDKGKVE